ncbi:CE1759 family FMN reductase [Bifidobacterium crudilactis]|jgi:FMN reductase|uniref:NADH-dependent FMN reductase n=1 Tax=Bifidobacterium crudilactis TaxID=327277 RepID=A0A971IDW3_9BIFI|nr:CE1759 family FMN reductase [Bifidobacterium crudilactis]MCI1869006.1 NAD(P)H-dependent oxidoreductase [Bifidobacterium crudilactis]MDN5972631.1 NAD(P)H-dependent oxidoreductase [Bifidobacterium crudilactis]MDN6001151.1 NAD(P)H-dependent oxidoreductase [Bifidobacterium crudilactis]MDN6210540.1 NAD(P)H-dependent oxidoreductase [Bifidobacterium crudilactis]MDN6233617.1 NAD(P)H-dependent oxidoreductase [Bifidobacterium crudilactis]
MNDTKSSRRHITVVSAGVGEPSTTTKLAEGIAEKTAQQLQHDGHAAQVNVIELKNLAKDIAIASVSWRISPELQAALDIVVNSDALVAASPVFKATYSGLFKSFWDIAAQDALLGMPVAVVATAGSERHALVPDTSMRSLFAFMRAIVVPTGVMAATVDWGSDGLLSRQTRVAAELASMVTAEVRKSMLAAVGDRYTRSAVDLNVELERDDSDTASADSGVPNAPSLDFDSELMKLAAGGR